MTRGMRRRIIIGLCRPNLSDSAGVANAIVAVAALAILVLGMCSGSPWPPEIGVIAKSIIFGVAAGTALGAVRYGDDVCRRTGILVLVIAGGFVALVIYASIGRLGFVVWFWRHAI